MAVLLLGMAGMYVKGLKDPESVQGQSTHPVLTASELVIADANGVVRARLGTKMPDAIVNGKTRPRGDEIAGLLLYDDTGQERGGYVTFKSSGYVGLTVDSRDNMVGSFLAGPKGGAILQLSDGGLVQLRKDKDWAEVRADDTGAQISIIRNGELISRTPPLSADDVNLLCGRIKIELVEKRKMPVGRAVEVCKERMSGDQCRACLAVPQPR
jgi:hypothetical protein